MVFTSVEFVVFFCVLYPLYLISPFRAKVPLLIAASLFFYGYVAPQHTWILVAVIVVGYLGGISIENREQRGRPVLAFCIIVLLALLGFYKYTDFGISLINTTMAHTGHSPAFSPLEILLPVGISFFTFQTIGYLIDVYRKDTKAERNLPMFALFVSYFPQLVAGPIERSNHLLKEIRTAFGAHSSSHLVSSANISSGCRLILLGFFKKVCIADNLSVYVDTVFANPGAYGPAATTLAVYCFAVQIYCDFSGYTDIARGIGRIMGIELMENFRQPYFAASIREFWTRWHISLSTWFRDYLYRPLGGNRVGEGRWLFNILAVFILSGLWHGAALNFVIWGTVHGVIYVLERTFGNIFSRRRAGAGLATEGLAKDGGAIHWTASRLLAVAFTFHVVCFAWIFFRAPTFDVATDVLRSIAGLSPGTGMWTGMALFSGSAFKWCGVFVAGLLLIDLFNEKYGARAAGTYPAWQRWTVYFAIASAIIVFGNWGASQQFIYFQF